MNELLNDLNPDDFLDHKQSEADKALAVKFLVKSVQDKVQTLAQGRPIFKEVVYIDIRIPGERESAFCGPATRQHVQRFPEHYRAFRNRTSENEVVGTPLAEWPLVTRSQVEELSFFNVKTVEDLVNMPDSSNHQFMGINTLKAKAKEFLDANKGKKELQAEFDKREQALQEQLKAMQAQLDALSAGKPKVRAAAKPRVKKDSNVSDTHINS